jgi:hypothetical protein|tara:strand:+ start:357 stop:524 length:168 start_codon:yes stop_codon:yes gene_type:complete
MNKKIKNIFLNGPFKSVKRSSYFYAKKEIFKKKSNTQRMMKNLLYMYPFQEWFKK